MTNLFEFGKKLSKFKAISAYPLALLTHFLYCLKHQVPKKRILLNPEYYYKLSKKQLKRFKKTETYRFWDKKTRKKIPQGVKC